MYIVCDDKAGRVYGMFKSEQSAIDWAKTRYRNMHNSWWVELVSPIE